MKLTKQNNKELKILFTQAAQEFTKNNPEVNKELIQNILIGVFLEVNSKTNYQKSQEKK